MKLKLTGFLILLTSITGFAQDESQEPEGSVEMEDLEEFEGYDSYEYLDYDSIEASFQYETGIIELSDGIGKIVIPEGFKYLNPEQAEVVLTDYWGNPDGEDITMGFILRKEQKLFNDSGYVFNIEYEEIGYVEDDDADEIDYDELLETLQEESIEGNKYRAEMGYEPIAIIGWAAEPFYDKERKILHWAKELKFGTYDDHTLNYNIRILGRKGVLVLNAIGGMQDLPLVQNDLNNVLDIVQFNEGYRYADFDPDLDEVAAWTLGGLVAGKVLAKAGFFALILKFWKFIAIGAVGLFAAFKKKFKKKKKNPDDHV